MGCKDKVSPCQYIYLSAIDVNMNSDFYQDYTFFEGWGETNKINPSEQLQQLKTSHIHTLTWCDLECPSMRSSLLVHNVCKLDCPESDLSDTEL